MKFLHMWHVCDVKMSTHMQNLCYFVIKSVFLQSTQFCREICRVVIYALLCGEKFIKKFSMWRKNDKYEVCSVPGCGLCMGGNVCIRASK